MKNGANSEIFTQNEDFQCKNEPISKKPRYKNKPVSTELRILNRLYFIVNNFSIFDKAIATIIDTCEFIIN